MPSLHLTASNDIFVKPQSNLGALSIAHDDLDAAIAALLKNGLFDDLLINRLKKHKLRIKDEIALVLAADMEQPVACAS